MGEKSRRLCLLLSWLLITNGLQSQVINDSDYKTIDYSIITRFVSVLETKRPVSFDSLAMHAAGFQLLSPENKPFIFKGYNENYYWFRFIIQNINDAPKSLILSLGPTGIKDAELFQGGGSQWKSLGKTGHQYKFINRPYQYMHYAYPLYLYPRTTDTFYIRIDHDHDFKTFGFALVDRKEFKAYENKVYFLFGIIVGLLSLFLIFNLYAFFSLKEQVHLWYSLYIGLLIMIVLDYDQLNEQFLNFDSAVAFRLTDILTLGSLAIAVLMHVVQLYLVNIKPPGALYKITSFVRFNLIVSAITHFLIFYFKSDTAVEVAVFYWTDYSTMLGVLFIILNCCYSIYKGFKPALFILAGLGGFLTGAMQKLLLIPTQSEMFPPASFHIGVVLEITIISFGFIYSYGKEREEKLKLQSNFKHELHKTQLEIQDQTLRNISQEIHDNIGQVLSLVKLNLASMDCSNPHSLREKICTSSELVVKAIKDLRELAKSLNTDTIVEIGLIKAIEYEFDVLKRVSNFQTFLKQHAYVPVLPPHYELIVFRIFQEAVNNILKHANATMISVETNCDDETFKLKIMDNGKGFDISALNTAEAGIGIRNMRNRAHIIGADYKIESEVGKGTTVTIVLSI